MISKILSVMLFLPSISFNMLPAEIFPWAIIKSTLIRFRLRISDVIVLSILIIGLVGGLMLRDEINVLTTFASYLNPILIFMLLSRVTQEYCEALSLLAQKIFFSLTILGLLQLAGVLTPVQGLFELLISRGGSGPVGGGRGVTLLATEPSRAGVEYVFIYALLVAASARVTLFVRGSLVQDLLFLLFLILVIRSGTGFAFGLIYIGIRRPIVILPILAVAVITSFYLGVESRALSLGSDIIQQDGLTEFVRLLTIQSGFRVVSVVSAYVYAADHLVGLGIGAWASEAVNSYVLAGYSVSDTNYFLYYSDNEFVNLKPTAFGALVGLELGLIPLVTIAFYIFQRSQVLFLRAGRSEISLGLIFLLYVFGVGAVGNPVPWVCAALAIRFKTKSFPVVQRDA